MLPDIASAWQKSGSDRTEMALYKTWPLVAGTAPYTTGITVRTHRPQARDMDGVASVEGLRILRLL